jgi:uncharacterized membrane protein YjjP (DUF1212 family)
MNYDDLISTAVEVGYLLITNGGEIYRAEESMLRIFRAYGVETGEVFAIPTFINATVSTPQGRPVTKIRRIFSRETNMDRVEQVNDLCRRICRTTPDFAYIRRELARIEGRPSFSFPVQVAAFALVAFSFTLFYGGNYADALTALFCGAVIKLVCHVLEKFRVNSFFVNILASFAAAAVALGAAHWWAVLSYDKIIIGALMNLVPGIAITSFMRDIIAGDLIAGILRLTESTLVAAAIAIGAGFALTATRMLWGV